MCYNNENVCSEHLFAEGGKLMADILHCDLNNFYASVEIRDDPSLAGKPIAVCGSIEDRSGIVLAKNDLAKAYGIKTAEKIYEAKQKCHDLVIVAPHMEKYSLVSKQVRAIYARYTDMVEPFGLDECWLDVTGSHYLFGTSEQIANEIREAVKRETGLTISVGVSFTKVLAKLGSDLKKPDAVTVLPRNGYMNRIKDLPANEMVGIGPATMRALSKLRIYTLGMLAASDPEMLRRHLGKAGISLWRAVNGFENEAVHDLDYSREIKSVGNSTTLRHDLETNEQVWQVMLSLAEDVTRRMRADFLCARGVCISVKTNDLCYREFQAGLEYPLRSALSLTKAGFRLFTEKFDWHLPIRALGIRGINLMSSLTERQYTLFSDTKKLEKEETLADVSDRLRQRYGKGTIYPARLQNDLFSSKPKINAFNNIHVYDQ